MMNSPERDHSAKSQFWRFMTRRAASDSSEPTFRHQPFTRQQTVGERLRAAREAEQISLEAIAGQLRITQRYLEAIEGGRYHELPSLLYSKQYTRLYAQAVGIPWRRIGEQYEEEVRVYQSPQYGVDTSSLPQTTSTAVHHRTPLLLPRVFRIGIIGIAVFLLVLYLAWELVQFLEPPPLVIIHPEHDMIVTERDLLVVGQSAPEAIVQMNGQDIAVDPDGGFAERISLHDGVNTIRISVRSKRSSEREEIRHILYEPASQ